MMNRGVKYIIYFFGALMMLLFFVGCEHWGTNTKTPTGSLGKINSVLVVSDPILWNGAIGDSIRRRLAAPVLGLPEEEPMFSIDHTAAKHFEGVLSNTRNVVCLSIGNTHVDIQQDAHVSPQTVIHLHGKDEEELSYLFSKYIDEMIEKFHHNDIIEYQLRFQNSLLNTAAIQEKFKIDLSIPSSYKYVMDRPGFMWIRKEVQSGYNSLLLYEVPINRITRDSNTVAHIIKVRDSIGSFIQSSVPQSRMITEESYYPYVFEQKLDHRYTIETKGNWQMLNDNMGGPYVNFAIRDDKNQRYLIVEGFCYRPSAPKRDLMYELESIIRTLRFVN